MWPVQARPEPHLTHVGDPGCGTGQREGSAGSHGGGARPRGWPEAAAPPEGLRVSAAACAEQDDLHMYVHISTHTWAVVAA